MSYEQLVMRLLSIVSTIPLNKIIRGNLTESDSTKLFGGRLTLDSKQLYIDETLSNNLEDLKLQCRKLKRENKLDFIVIHYLQLLQLSSSRKEASRYEEVTQISDAAFTSAVELM